MKIALKLLTLAALLVVGTSLAAQRPQTVMMDDPTAGPAIDTSNYMTPVNDIIEKRDVGDRQVLPYDHVREADIMWEKRVWRVIDIREKMNLPFAYPERPFFTILQEAGSNGEIAAYTDDSFETRLSAEEIQNLGRKVDTIRRVDPITYEEEIVPVVNELDVETIKRFRLMEIWFFDEETSTLQVRILGVAPLKEEYDEMGNLLFEIPMFWVYYPELRHTLAKEEAYAYGNDAANRSWEDVFESRFFSSYIYKESDVQSRALKDYLTGYDLLLEADRIKQEIFNFEHDLWEY
jgi:gliding motility associated protien GldN